MSQTRYCTSFMFLTYTDCTVATKFERFDANCSIFISRMQVIMYVCNNRGPRKRVRTSSSYLKIDRVCKALAVTFFLLTHAGTNARGLLQQQYTKANRLFQANKVQLRK